MKKQVMTVALIGTMLCCGLLMGTAFAAKGMNHGERRGLSMEDRQERLELKLEKRLELMADLLDLSEAQQLQVRAVHEQEQAKLEPYRQQMDEGHEALRGLLDSDIFDEAAIRSLAATQANFKTEMMVSRARVRHQTFALLNAEQQALAKKLQPLLHNQDRQRPGR